jgi:hypothetical protein
MTPMATSNSINVNAREALIEFALKRISVAYHETLTLAKHFFRILPPGATGHYVRSSAFTRQRVVNAPNRPAKCGMELQTGAVRECARLPGEMEGRVVTRRGARTAESACSVLPGFRRYLRG